MSLVVNKVNRVYKSLYMVKVRGLGIEARD